MESETRKTFTLNDQKDKIIQRGKISASCDYSKLNREARSFVSKIEKDMMDRPSMYSKSYIPHPDNLHDTCVFRRSIKDESWASTSASPLNTYLLNLRNAIRYEYIQKELDLKEFDMFNVKLEITKRFNGNKALLKVPGIAEGKPSLSIHDKVHLVWGTDRGIQRLEVFIMNVLGDSNIIIDYPFDKIDGVYIPNPEYMLFHVRFEVFCDHHLLHVYNRILYDMFSSSDPDMNQVVMLMEEDKMNSDTLIPLYTMNVEIPQVSINVGLNTEQNRAIYHVLELTGKIVDRSTYNLSIAALNSPLVLLYGPAGCGKSVCIVEMVFQILSLYPTSKILFCTPSDYSADLVTSRLVNGSIKGLSESNQLTPIQLLRLNTYNRHTSIPECVKPYCKTNQLTGLFLIPPVHELYTYSCIVCTCQTAARTLVDLKLNTKHFTHFILDEAAQANDPETLVCLSLLNNKTISVLSGDLAQMSPDTKSVEATKLGLNISFFEKLLTRSNRPPCVLLSKNYRTNPTLLDFISRTFYEGVLKSSKLVVDKNILTWNLLQRPFPLYFHSVIGHDIYEQEQSSFYNLYEIEKVTEIIQSLLAQKELNVSLPDIAVIAPFKLHVHMLRKHLRKIDNLGMIRVEDIDALQGSESKVIILSTVTSRNTHYEDTHVAKAILDAMNKPARFTVAVSRAKELLIIVGNPYVLMKDEDWKKLLIFADQNGAYYGSSKPIGLNV
ncbi:MAG: putative RNA helicase SDE3 [Sylvanvirus sp.]|uniref:Putative RNA helicase SDE3 n=1 Tax=Sylvanvirus sp. TaxID=2487774 RepID=A0A3G5AL86_9VIRU|nr:MAG: putative RNA helicase SDE3 [Sylvanvirus sp.]